MAMQQSKLFRFLLPFAGWTLLFLAVASMAIYCLFWGLWSVLK